MKGNSKNQNSRSVQKKSKNTNKLQIARNLPAFPGQKTFNVTLRILPSLNTTTVTTGVIALSSQITITSINGWNPNFQNTWEEYRIVACRSRVTPFSSTNAGLLTAWFDEKNSAAPTLQESVQKNVKMIGAAQVNKPLWLSWHARDPLDLQYQLPTVAYTPVTMKVYTNNANWGASIVATPYFLLETWVDIQFRGLA